MTEEGEAEALEPVAVDESDEPKKKKPKAPKAKKRPSDFEIVRTILQRTSERKQAYLLKNLGEDPDLLFLCSVDESGFTYGSPDLSIALIRITDPELKGIVDGYLGKFHGLQENSFFSGFVCLRDQISEIGKTKGESFEQEVYSNDHGSSWILRPDPKGNLKPHYLSLAIESLFHVNLVTKYCALFSPLLTGDNPDHLYYPYTHEDNSTASIIRLPAPDDHTHVMTQAYPHGFRAMITKGLDVGMTKCVTGDFPYPVTQEEMIVCRDSGFACRMVHRIIAQGWTMITVRPNAVFFPLDKTSLPSTGIHSL